MSHDLFAAFGSLQSTDTGINNDLAVQRSEHSTPVPKRDSHDYSLRASGPGQQASQYDEEEDDFGEFEDAPASEPPASAPVPSNRIPVDVPTAKPSVPLSEVRGHGAKTASNANVGPRRETAPKASSAPKADMAPKPSTAPQAPKQPAAVGRHPFADHMDFLFAADADDEYDAGTDDLGDLSNNPEAAVAYSKRVIAAQMEEEQRRQVKQPQSVAPQANVRAMEEPRSPKKLQKKYGYAPTKGSTKVPTKASNVLFDAENVSDVEDDDAFGDFEGSSVNSNAQGFDQPKANSANSSATMPAMDLLGLDVSAESPQLDSRITGSSMAAHQSRDETSRISSRQRDARLAAPAAIDDEAWSDFETSTAAPAKPSARRMPSQRTTKATAATSLNPPKAASSDSLPPTNIPPPAILLSIFPALFASAEEALFKPLAKLDFKQRQILLAHPATAMFLQGYLGLSVVLGHIIAGRKLRWKRDQSLAQGMRIGPAAAAGGGMKLAGVDKAELAKEEREVLDAVRLWKAQVGKLRGAVTTAISTPGIPKLPTVPEIAETMPIRSLKPAEGGLTASHGCALCGLKREERVAKVDVEVEDSFGEWWVQGMSMHVLCRDFWEEHRGKLRSR
ncbi:hypothetical protein LTR36_008015 [Oleoguttula mirabilis]|uniref:Uncharacterized protein n=1 Tax=Oleoguttula mirabilis TaxID=1507867 RepID=A0AAV9J8K2_9PEZI|nr:hypothetical protein LTR36_008015 [Oleoguttula mirabilis]